MLIYIAGAYSATTPEGVRLNVERASAWHDRILYACAEYLNLGPDDERMPVLLCPHTMTYPTSLQTPLWEAYWYRATLAMLDKCDALFVLPESDNSRGTQCEITRALATGKRVLYPADLEDIVSFLDLT